MRCPSVLCAIDGLIDGENALICPSQRHSLPQNWAGYFFYRMSTSLRLVRQTLYTDIIADLFLQCYVGFSLLTKCVEMSLARGKVLLVNKMRLNSGCGQRV